MTELIIKMILCLVVALVLGFIIGWLLSKISQSKKYLLEVDVLNSIIEDRNSRIETFENQFTEKETTLLKYNHENRKLKTSLIEKTTLLDNAESSINENLSAKEENQVLLEQITHLEGEVKNKIKEVQELETVLIKAENTIEAKEKLVLDGERQLSNLKLNGTQNIASLSSSEIPTQEVEKLQDEINDLSLRNEERAHSIVLYQDTIAELEKELKLYTVNGEEDEFVISKDQFTHIEEQLVEYQKEINQLKEENSRLFQLNNNDNVKEKSMPLDEDDIAIVKLFRETYKKITKS